MRQITLLLLLFTFTCLSLAYPSFSHSSVSEEFKAEPFKQTQKAKVNKSLDIITNTTESTINASYESPICTFEEISTSHAIKNAIKTTRVYIFNTILIPTVEALAQLGSIINTLRKNTQTYISNAIVIPTVDILKQDFIPLIEGVHHQMELAIFEVNFKCNKLEDKTKQLTHEFILNSIDYAYINVIHPISITILSVNMKVKSTSWEIMDTIDETKEKMAQAYEDFNRYPSLEWHLFLNKVNKILMNFVRYLAGEHYAQSFEWKSFLKNANMKWSSFCHSLGVGDRAPYLCHDLFLRNQPFIENPYFHFDYLFQDALEIDHHSRFYQQQMTGYFNSIGDLEHMILKYSKYKFNLWAKRGKSLWHDFADEMQRDWAMLIPILYKDFEKIGHCLLSPLPTTINKVDRYFKNENGLTIIDPKAFNFSRQFYQEQRQRYNKKNQNRLHLRLWQHELLTLSEELDKTIRLVCYPPRNPSGTIKRRSKNEVYQKLSLRNNKMKSQKAISKYVSKRKLNLNLKGPIQEIIDELTKLQKHQSKQFITIDKRLRRTLFNTLPPSPNQPMHLFYERLRDNASARTRSTFNKYMYQLLYSWNSIISTTLDITDNMIDDLKWIREKQLLEKKSSNTTMNFNQHQQKQHDHFKTELELIWTKSKEKLYNNNLQVVQLWESIFINMDIEMQEAWEDMLVIVNESHQLTTLEIVKRYLAEKKIYLSNFFTKICHSFTN
ncbi:unnamed protein product [Cunninghamella blakesleeana]